MVRATTHREITKIKLDSTLSRAIHLMGDNTVTKITHLKGNIHRKGKEDNIHHKAVTCPKDTLLIRDTHPKGNTMDRTTLASMDPQGTQKGAITKLMMFRLLESSSGKALPIKFSIRRIVTEMGTLILKSFRIWLVCSSRNTLARPQITNKCNF